MAACLLATLAAGRAQAMAAPGGTVCGTINQSQTWDPSGSPYVVTRNTTVTSGVTLTTLAATIVKFTGAGTGLVVNGMLQAQGTAHALVAFTSIIDNSVGGSTAPPDRKVRTAMGNREELDHLTAQWLGLGRMAGRAIPARRDQPTARLHR